MSSRSSKHGLDLLLIGAWFAIATGLAESALILFQKVALGHLIFMSLHTLWLAPIAYLMIFLLPAVALAVSGAIAPGRIKAPTAFFIFGVLAIGSLLLPFEQIHRAARAALALGGGVQLARTLTPRTEVTLKFMRWTLAPLTVLFLVTGAGMTIGAKWAEDRQVADLPTPPAGSPNVLFIVLDAVKADNLGAYGYTRDTSPNLDALARDGAVFEWFLASSPWSLPSHGTMFTGRYPHEQSGGFRRPIDDTYPTVAGALTAAGYATAGFSANLHYGSRDAGLARGFTHYEGYVGAPEGILRHSWLGQMQVIQDIASIRSWADVVEILKDQNFSTPYRRASHQKPAEEMTAAFLDWLPQADGHPFFAFINYYDAHFPYRQHAGFGEWLGDEPDAVSRYDSEIRYMDHQVGVLLKALAEAGRLENTVVIVTSDHGELFGAHDLTTHGNSLYAELLRVPLIIRYPERIPAGAFVSAATGMRHLPKTMLDLAGVDGSAFPGRSLVEIASDPAAGPVDSFVLSEHTFEGGPISTVLDRPRELRSLFDEELHYIRGPDGAEELYAYREDPGENRSLAGLPEYEEALARFRSALDQWFAKVR